MTEAGQQRRQELATDRVVLGDKHPQPAHGSRGGNGLGRCRRSRDPHRDPNSECTAHVQPALNLNVAPHQSGQLLGNLQPQSRPAKAADPRRITLGEAFEEKLYRRWSHPDSLVGDGEPDIPQVGRTGKRGGRDRNANLALFAELDRIADQVEQDLLQPGLVRLDPLRHIGLHRNRQSEVLGNGLGVHQRFHRSDQRGQFDRLCLKLQPT